VLEPDGAEGVEPDGAEGVVPGGAEGVVPGGAEGVEPDGAEMDGVAATERRASARRAVAIQEAWKPELAAMVTFSRRAWVVAVMVRFAGRRRRARRLRATASRPR